MKEIKQLLNKVSSEVAASQKHSTIEAGQTDTPKYSEQLVDAINQVFALFQINYHNQYYAAFGDSGEYESQAKKLWIDALSDFDSTQILKAAKKVIQDSDYLPTLQKMLSACSNTLAEYGIPDTRTAYQEAANAPSPKNAQQWSHPVVYLAGKQVGWYAMSHHNEHSTFTEYSKAYQQLIRQFLRGESMEIDQPIQLEDGSKTKAKKETVIRELSAIRQLLDE